MDSLQRTQRYYVRNWSRYAERTRDKLPRRNLYRFIRAFSAPGPVLDAGCGPGYATDVLRAQGYDVIACDFAFPMVAAAGFPAVCADLRQLPFRDGSFAGIWANASLLHIPYEQLLPTLQDLYRILQTGGVLYAGVKEKSCLRIPDVRHYEYYSCDQWEYFLERAGFQVRALWTDTERREHNGTVIPVPWLCSLAVRDS